MCRTAPCDPVVYPRRSQSFGENAAKKPATFSPSAARRCCRCSISVVTAAPSTDQIAAVDGDRFSDEVVVLETEDDRRRHIRRRSRPAPGEGAAGLPPP